MSATSSRSDCELIDRLGFDRSRVDDRLADVAERLVHRVRERVDGRRLAVAGDDEAAPAMRLQILGDGVDRTSARRRTLTARRRPTCARRTPTRRRDRARERLDLARLAAAADDRRARRSTSASLSTA